MRTGCCWPDRLPRSRRQAVRSCAVRKWYEATYRKFQRVKVDIVHEISHGNEAAFEFKATLTDTAGKVITPVGVNIVRVEGGKYREVRAYFDSSILR